MKKPVQNLLAESFAAGTNIWMVGGMERIEPAKMMGITPDILTFIGIWVFWPPYILRPTTRLAYWTGMRLSALSIHTMNAIIRTRMTQTKGERK